MDSDEAGAGAERADRAERDRFGEEVAAHIRAFASVAEAHYDPDDFSVVYTRGDTGKSGTCYLANGFRECEGVSAEERAVRIANLASIADQRPLPDTWDEVRPALRPVLRHATFGLGAPGDLRVLSRPAMPFLAELVVVDTPTSMAYVNVANTAKWGVAEDEVFDAARANMAEQAMRTLDRGEPGGPALIRFVDDGDGYLSSLPLVDGWLAGMGVRLGGRPLAFVTQHHGLLLTVEAGGGEGLPALLAMAEEEWREAVRPVSPVAYTVDDDARVVPYEVPPGHPARAALERAATMLAYTVYARQTDHYRGLPDADEGPFIAALQCFGREAEGSLFTVAAWGDGVAGLLPEAQWVSFISDGEHFTVPWEAVAREVALTPEPGYDPVRYRVDGWPAPEVMERLRGAAGTP